MIRNRHSEVNKRFEPYIQIAPEICLPISSSNLLLQNGCAIKDILFSPLWNQIIFYLEIYKLHWEKNKFQNFHQNSSAFRCSVYYKSRVLFKMIQYLEDFKDVYILFVYRLLLLFHLMFCV